MKSAGAESAAALLCLRALEAAGLVCCLADAADLSKWMLTDAGCQRLQFRLRLTQPRFIMHHRRSLPLQEMTTYELIDFLIQRGWELNALPPRFQTKSLEPYVRGGPKVAYVAAGAKTIHHNYMLLLALAEQGKHAGPVMHCGPAKEYAVSVRSALKPGDLQAVADHADGLGELEDMFSGSGDEDMFSGSGDEADAVADNDGPNEGNVEGILDMLDGIAEAELQGPPGRRVDEGAPGAHAEAAEVGREASRGDQKRRRVTGDTRTVHEQSFRWNGFYFTYRPPTAKFVRERWQVTCPYHVYVDTQGKRIDCTRTRTLMEGVTREQLILTLKRWCGMAVFFPEHCKEGKDAHMREAEPGSDAEVPATEDEGDSQAPQPETVAVPRVSAAATSQEQLQGQSEGKDRDLDPNASLASLIPRAQGSQLSARTRVRRKRPPAPAPNSDDEMLSTLAPIQPAAVATVVATPLPRQAVPKPRPAAKARVQAPAENGDSSESDGSSDSTSESGSNSNDAQSDTCTDSDESGSDSDSGSASD